MSNHKFRYRIAIIGNENQPDMRFDESQMKALKHQGFNMVQLNIAWGSRPADEALNLEDVVVEDGNAEGRVKERFDEIRRRAIVCKKYGFRTLFHFGAPHIKNLYKLINSPDDIDAATYANSILNKDIQLKYKRLLLSLADGIPEIDDILMYNFDQEAWIGNEFGNDSSARSIPIHERLPAFISHVCDVWRSRRPEGMLWWEPWEMSAGQIYATAEQLPDKNFGLMLHSNICEVKLIRPVDPWLKSMSVIAAKKNIPLIVECFFSSAHQDTSVLTDVATPHLIHNQFKVMEQLPHISGVKEYFGFIPDRPDPNIEMTRLILSDDTIPLDQALVKISGMYGAAAVAVRKAWDESSAGFLSLPWDLSWYATMFCLPSKMVYHGWSAFNQVGFCADTPAWQATRRGFYMVNKNEPELHPWMIEDVGLRYQRAADCFEKAGSHYGTALESAFPEMRDALERNRHDLAVLTARCRDQALHALETIAALNIRRYLNEGKQVPEHCYRRLKGYLEADVMNRKQGILEDKNKPAAEDMMAAFQSNPDEWVRTHLLLDLTSPR
jgi:hypothetical protein